MEGIRIAILLTNGQYYIAHNKTGAVIKEGREQAQDFHYAERALKQINKTPIKCKGYYWIDTEIEDTEPIKEDIDLKEYIKMRVKKNKRKKLSLSQRKIIYEKSNGYCQLCGRKMLYDNFTVDHIIPLGRGGTNDMDNLQGVCKVCNEFKANIFPEQFIDRITEIFVYQMEKNYSDNLNWKMARNLLMEIL